MTDYLHTFFAVISLLGGGIIAGVFFAVRVSVLPALCALAPGPYIEMHRSLGKGYHPAMPLIVNTTMFAQLGLAVLAPTVLARGLAVAGLVLSLGVQAVSHLANVPINRRLLAVDPDAVPADWDDPRPLWRNWHDLRTALAVASVVATALSIGI